MDSYTREETALSFDVLLFDHQEFLDHPQSRQCDPSFMKMLSSIRYCRVEIFPSGTFGTIRVPGKKLEDEELASLSFGFYIERDRILFVRRTGDLAGPVKKLASMTQDCPSPGLFLLMLLGDLTEEDDLYLQQLEEQIDELEDRILDGADEDCSEQIVRYNRKLSEIHFFYEQMINVCERLEDLEESADTAIYWQRYSGRATRLHDYITLLRGTVIQIRDLYQNRQDARTNKIINMLTVITALFLPLTLLTGWYGMNFANMPELRWSIGYPVLIVVSVVIVVVEIWIFKKKNIL